MLGQSLIRCCFFSAVAIGLGLFNWHFRDVWANHSGTSPAGSDIIIGKPVIPVRTGRNDCGPLCLYLICKSQGMPHGIEELRQLVNTTDEGNSLLDLKRGAKTLGFGVRAVNLPFNELLSHVARPGHYAIIHLPTRKHFSLAVATLEDRVVFADPGYGKQILGESELAERWEWKGDALLVASTSSNQ